MAPEESAKVASRKSRRSRFPLKIDTKPQPLTDQPSTPDTAASTPKTPSGVRGSTDVRSPGERKTPRVHTGAVGIPDFITQTDKDGNAITPVSTSSIHEMEQGEENGDNYESLLDSIRLMCCCLTPEDNAEGKPPESSDQSSLHTTPLIKQSNSRKAKRGILPSIHPHDTGKKCLVLDLDETLVHSSFRAVPGADFVIPVQIEDVVHFVYVAKRPGVDEFLVEMAKHYEIVIYTASLNKYADPLLDLLDPHRTIRSRLFRESCVYYEGSYVKDLSLLNRDLTQAIIIDNSPNSYIFHPDNAIDCTSFIDDPNDRELDQIAGFLKGIKDVEDVRGVAPLW
eukprot:CAMPEP_0194227672 /NCGR_PEP_ID=MMETSP0156-20130528/42978_1 /TAXON_ID=33649 /ORGANISM="Thalassionema nitzschioides, Strain L26-B" /LENGTH=338 /DNA_ID=CAMNT_0038960165 /DNA_START=1101 /DNA_END=2114 /DNA_ORIENTATION=+